MLLCTWTWLYCVCWRYSLVETSCILYVLHIVRMHHIMSQTVLNLTKIFTSKKYNQIHDRTWLTTRVQTTAPTDSPLSLHLFRTHSPYTPQIRQQHQTYCDSWPSRPLPSDWWPPPAPGRCSQSTHWLPVQTQCCWPGLWPPWVCGTWALSALDQRSVGGQRGQRANSGCIFDTPCHLYVFWKVVSAHKRAFIATEYVLCTYTVSVLYANVSRHIYRNFPSHLQKPLDKIPQN